MILRNTFWWINLNQQRSFKILLHFKIKVLLVCDTQSYLRHEKVNAFNAHKKQSNNLSEIFQVKKLYLKYFKEKSKSEQTNKSPSNILWHNF